jgi:hypothetical protein
LIADIFRRAALISAIGRPLAMRHAFSRTSCSRVKPGAGISTHADPPPETRKRRSSCASTNFRSRAPASKLASV